MKITFIFPKFSGPFGGERLVLKLASELIKNNIRVDLITNKFNNDCQYLLDKDINLIDKNFPISKNHNISTFLSLFYMPKLIKSIDFEGSNLICGIGWQSAYGLKKIIDMNHKNILYYCLEPPRFLYDLKNSDNISIFNKYIIKIISPIIKNIDHNSIANIENIYSISEWTQNQVKNIYNKPSKIIYPGVEKNRFKNLSKKSSRKILNIPQESVIYLSVSKLHKRKKLFKAINVFNNYKIKTRSNSKFYIIGNGPEKENIRLNPFFNTVKKEENTN